MDTWATSSLTPQIVTGWVDDDDLFARTFPMDLRPQGPEIIRTWLFDTVVRARFEHGALPWSDTTINGWVLDPDRKKMSKSKGNVVTPMPLVEEYGPDALAVLGVQRAAGSRHRGRLRDHEDRAQARDQDPQRVEVHAQHRDAAPCVADRRSRRDRRAARPVDARDAGRRWSTTRPRRSTPSTTRARSSASRRFFWSFCDDYVELVKGRAYGGAGAAPAASAAIALRAALSTLLRMFAPFMPFVTEEVWSWFETARCTARRGPTRRRCGSSGADPLVFEVAAEVLAAVRKAKSEQKRSLDDAGRRASSCTTPRSGWPRSLRAEPDVREAGKIAELATGTGAGAARRGRARAARRRRELTR